LGQNRPESYYVSGGKIVTAIKFCNSYLISRELSDELLPRQPSKMERYSRIFESASESEFKLCKTTKVNFAVEWHD